MQWWRTIVRIINIWSLYPKNGSIGHLYNQQSSEAGLSPSQQIHDQQGLCHKNSHTYTHTKVKKKQNTKSHNNITSTDAHTDVYACVDEPLMLLWANFGSQLLYCEQKGNKDEWSVQMLTKQFAHCGFNSWETHPNIRYVTVHVWLWSVVGQAEVAWAVLSRWRTM